MNEGVHHPRKDNIQSFARGTVQLRVGQNDYTAEVLVGERKNGTLILYDLLNLKPTKIEGKSQVRHSVDPSPGTARKTALDSQSSVAQPGEEVKGEYSSQGQRGVPAGAVGS